MTDLLRMDYINSLPQPFLVRFAGDRNWWWPVHDFEVQTGLIRIDVCGKLQVKNFGEVMEIKDGAGTSHDPDTFYSEEESRMTYIVFEATDNAGRKWRRTETGMWEVLALIWVPRSVVDVPNEVFTPWAATWMSA